MVKLSILIPTMPPRKSVLSRLLWGIERQLTEEVEVIVHKAPKPMGSKLNEMFGLAKGDFVVCVDDDDELLDDYFPTVLPLLTDKVDFLGYDILVLQNGHFDTVVSHSISGDQAWGSTKRGVSPKCPIRTELARQCYFPDEYTGDRIWSQAVANLLDPARCESIGKVMYIYDWWAESMLGTEPDSSQYVKNKDRQRNLGKFPFNEGKFQWL